MENKKTLFESTKLENIEEEIKNKVLLPYLQQLGFTPDEIFFEKYFSLKFGKGTYKIDTQEQVERAGGRLDILCKKNEVNLFVIEAKRPGIKISEDDRDQGIDYARLLDQIAPFVIVTNGNETRVYDTITKEELTNSKNIGEESNFFKNGYRLSNEDDIRIRYEALRHFVSYSPENLHKFCSIQQADRMQTLKGNAKDLDKKYLPELYVNRDYIAREFKTFLEKSNVCCFAIVGESGVGKTNTICALAESTQSENLSLFFNAPDLIKGIWKAIADDFNWEFSAEKSEIQLIKDLEGLLSRTNQYICIFIDAVDEASENFRLELDDFINRVKNRRFKIVVTCKNTEWEQFLKRSGNPTILSQNIYLPLDSYVAYSEQTNKEIKNQPGIFLKKFTDEELREAEEKYRKIFHFQGTLSGPLKNQCSLPFMLRVVSEVYQNSNDEIPIDSNDIELLRKYIEWKLFGSYSNGVPIDPNAHHTDDRGASRATVIRNAVYDEVKKELKKIINSIT